MRSIVITGLLSVVSFATGLGFEVSGYENIYLAYGLWVLAAILAIVALCLWLVPKLKHKQEEYTETHEIEVPEELQEKVRGIPKVKGKVLDIKNHIVRKKVRK